MGGAVVRMCGSLATPWLACGGAAIKAQPSKISKIA